jgi:hypothetical protein
VPEPSDEFDGTLSKPFTRLELRDAVTRLLPATGLSVA